MSSVINIDYIDSYFDCPCLWIARSNGVTVSKQKGVAAIRKVLNKLIHHYLQDDTFVCTAHFIKDKLKELSVDWETDEYSFDAAVISVSLLHDMFVKQIAPKYKFVLPSDYSDTDQIVTDIKTDNITCTLNGFVPYLIETSDNKLRICLFIIGAGSTVTTDNKISSCGYRIRGAFLTNLLKYYTSYKVDITDRLDTSSICLIGIKIAKTDRGIRWHADDTYAIPSNLFVKCVQPIINSDVCYGNPRSKSCTPFYCPVYDSCIYR